jgi:hypothetical protein
MRKPSPTSATIRCPDCGAPGNRFPGFRIEHLGGAVMTGEDIITVDPMRLTCRSCGFSWFRRGEFTQIIPESEARAPERRPPGAQTPVPPERPRRRRW